MELQLNIMDHFSQCHAVYQQTSRMLNFIIFSTKSIANSLKYGTPKLFFTKKCTCMPEGENYLAIFHAFICVLWPLWVYYKFTRPALMPVCMIPQLVEHCTSIVESWVWILWFPQLLIKLCIYVLLQWSLIHIFTSIKFYLARSLIYIQLLKTVYR